MLCVCVSMLFIYLLHLCESETLQVYNPQPRDLFLDVSVKLATEALFVSTLTFFNLFRQLLLLYGQKK